MGALALGELVAYISASAAGVTFRPFGVLQGIQADNWISLLTVAVVLAITLVVYLYFRQNAIRQTSGSMRASAASNAASRYAYGVMYGTLSMMFVVSLVLVFTLGENVMFLVPFALAVIAMVLWHLTSLKIWLLAAIAVVILQAVSFLYALYMALTIGALGVVVMLAVLDAMVLITLSDLYLSSQHIKKNKK